MFIHALKPIFQHSRESVSYIPFFKVNKDLDIETFRLSANIKDPLWKCEKIVFDFTQIPFLEPLSHNHFKLLFHQKDKKRKRNYFQFVSYVRRTLNIFQINFWFFFVKKVKTGFDLGKYHNKVKKFHESYQQTVKVAHRFNVQG